MFILRQQNHDRRRMIESVGHLSMATRQLVAEYEIDGRGPAKYAHMLRRGMRHDHLAEIDVAVAYDLTPATMGEYDITIGIPIGHTLPTRVTFTGQTTNVIDRVYQLPNPCVYDLWDFMLSARGRVADCVYSAAFHLDDESCYNICQTLMSSMGHGPVRTRMIADDVAEIARRRMAQGRLTRVAEDRPVADMPRDTFISPATLAIRRAEWDVVLDNHLPVLLGRMVIAYTVPFYPHEKVMEALLNWHGMYLHRVDVDDTTEFGRFWSIQIYELPHDCAMIAYRRSIACQGWHVGQISVPIGTRKDLWLYMCGAPLPTLDKFICNVVTSSMSVDDVNARLRAALKARIGPQIMEALDLLPSL